MANSAKVGMLIGFRYQRFMFPDDSYGKLSNFIAWCFCIQRGMCLHLRS